MEKELAIALEFINLIIPIKVIEEKYPGGIEQCLMDHEALLGERIWRDGHLWREGAMNSMEMFFLIEKWQSKGLKTTRKKNGAVQWADMCVVESFFSEDLNCAWLAIDDRGCAYLRGSEPGAVVGGECSGLG